MNTTNPILTNATGKALYSLTQRINVRHNLFMNVYQKDGHNNPDWYTLRIKTDFSTGTTKEYTGDAEQITKALWKIHTRKEAKAATAEKERQKAEIERAREEAGGPEKYYFIQVWGCVQPILNGPYNTQAERDAAMKDKIKEEGIDDHSYFALSGRDITID